MAENEFQPLERFIVEDLETLRVMADPLRTQIYEILLAQPGNVRQVAERLGLTPSRLYYHINMLEKCGLLRVVDTRMVSNIQEKVYRAVAYELEVAPGLLDFKTEQGKQSVVEMVTGALDTTREDLLRSLQARALHLDRGMSEKPRSVVVSRATAAIPDNLADEFRERLRALLTEFGSQEDADFGERTTQQYALMIAFYPSFYYQAEDGAA